MAHHNFRKVAIITYSGAYNYGSALQTYALNKYLRNIGFDAVTIDYTSDSQQNLYKIFEPCRGLMPLARNLQSLCKYRALKKHLKRFDKFLDEQVPMVSWSDSKDAKRQISETYDFFVCGSDQIWNAQCDDFDDNYMLSFVSDKKKCVAYSPSLGAGGESDNTIDALKRNVLDFRALSCRESNGSSIISRVTGRQVETTADPVLLLSENEWNEIAPDRVVEGDYILGYFIGDRAGMRDFAKQMSKSTGMPVVVIYKNLRDIKYGFKTKYDCGPTEFVSLIKHARGIVTNSFHAVAFSLIYKKDFWVFTGKGDSDSRISGILDLAGLQQRIVDGDRFKMNDYLDHICYEDLDMSGLLAYVDSSKEYLNNSLC